MQKLRKELSKDSVKVNQEKKFAGNSTFKMKMIMKKQTGNKNTATAEDSRC